MSARKFIFFDCMETLIDMKEIPSKRDYAIWALIGSGVEEYWEGTEQFIEQYCLVQNTFRDKSPLHREYEISERLRYMIKEMGKITEEETDFIINRLKTNYWREYKKRCQVSGEVLETLNHLNEHYGLGLISNFIVKDGIEELLRIFSLEKFFSVVITSVNEGWRKPHPELYEIALAKAGIQAEESLFIGDDYINDYVIPNELGFKAFLYDRNGRYMQEEQRFTAMRDLKAILSEK